MSADVNTARGGGGDADGGASKREDALGPWARWLWAAGVRFCVFSGFWLVLSRGQSEYLLYGVFTVVSGVALSMVLSRPTRSPRPALWLGQALGWSRLLVWFLWQSVRGGVDVALRVVRREPRIDPTVVRAAVDVPAGVGRVVAMLMMNVMPGSLIQRVWQEGSGQDDTWVELHTLSESLDPASQWKELQARVSAACAHGR